VRLDLSKLIALSLTKQVDELRQSYNDWRNSAKRLKLWHSSASIPVNPDLTSTGMSSPEDNSRLIVTVFLL